MSNLSYCLNIILFSFLVFSGFATNHAYTLRSEGVAFQIKHMEKAEKYKNLSEKLKNENEILRYALEGYQKK